MLLHDLAVLSEAVRDRAFSVAGADDRPDHGVHAGRALGLKLAPWYTEIGRAVERVRRARAVVSVGRLGTVGTFAHLPAAIEADVCRPLGLSPAPVSSQVVQRDRHAELLAALAITAASLESSRSKFAASRSRDRRGRSRSPRDGRARRRCRQAPSDRVGESGRPRAAAARQRRCHRRIIALWHGGHLALVGQRVILPDSFIAARSHASGFTRIVTGIVVYLSECARTSSDLAGWSSPERSCWSLPEKVYRASRPAVGVQRNAMQSFADRRDFKALLLADPDVTRVLDPAGIERAFDLDQQFRHVDHVFDRVFQEASVRV